MMSIGNLPESLSQAMLVGCNVSREIGRTHVPDSVTQRLGIPGVTTHAIRSLFLAFHMYHAVKVGHRGAVLTALAASDFASPCSKVEM